MPIVWVGALLAIAVVALACVVLVRASKRYFEETAKLADEMNADARAMLGVLHEALQEASDEVASLEGRGPLPRKKARRGRRGKKKHPVFQKPNDVEVARRQRVKKGLEGKQSHAEMHELAREAAKRGLRGTNS